MKPFAVTVGSEENFLPSLCKLWLVQRLLDAGTVCIYFWGQNIDYFALCFCSVRRKNEASLQKDVLLFVDLYCSSRIRGILFLSLVFKSLNLAVL